MGFTVSLLRSDRRRSGEVSFIGWFFWVPHSRTDLTGLF